MERGVEEDEEASVAAKEEKARVALGAAAVVGVGEGQEPICSCSSKTLPSGYIGVEHTLLCIDGQHICAKTGHIPDIQSPDVLHSGHATMQTWSGCLDVMPVWPILTAIRKIKSPQNTIPKVMLVHRALRASAALHNATSVGIQWKIP